MRLLTVVKEPTEKKVRYFMIWFVVGCGVATGSGFLWINHRDIVPITGRHHTIVGAQSSKSLHSLFRKRQK